MKIVIGGASGLVGSALTAELAQAGHEVFPLVRNATDNPLSILWDPARGVLPVERLEGMDAIVNLSGENVAGGRWNAARKRAIEESRVMATRLISQTVQKLSRPPKVVVNASAIGFYGLRGAEILSEDSPKGEGFLPQVCAAWEDAGRGAESVCRAVTIRIGIVLARNGGALGKMLLPFSLGVGGVVGSGEQFMSWIHLKDLVRLFRWAIENDTATGVYNGVAPVPVTNRAFTKALGSALRRPTLFPLPAFGVKVVFGEMGETLLLGSTRVLPKRLEAAGFAFEYSEVGAALKSLV